VTSTLAAFGVASAFWLSVVPFGNDALVYREGAARLLSGDPWAVTVAGYSYAAPPLEALPFLPFVPLPAAAFLAMWLGLTIAAAAWIVRRLRLDATYLLYPPLVMGVALGNPAVLGMACVVGGLPLLGLVLRPHLVLVAPRRAVVAFAVLSGLMLVVRPDFPGALATIVARYAAESRPINFWASPLMAPAILAIALLARVDRTAAAWLLMPAIGPAMGWYGFAMVLPVRSRALALACALPIPFAGATAIVVYAAWAGLRRTAPGSKALQPAA
jgi:hypothetical protein